MFSLVSPSCCCRADLIPGTAPTTPEADHHCFLVSRVTVYCSKDSRRRLINHSPGEPLPQIPHPTHSPVESGPPHTLPPHVSVEKVLASIPRNAADHDIASVTWAPERYRMPWDSTKILPRAMTTTGGQNYHPSGTRDLTLREYASLQGFPPKHLFGGKYVKRQIGNAVPPIVAKVLFGSLKRDLERQDGVEGPDLIE